MIDFGIKVMTIFSLIKEHPVIEYELFKKAKNKHSIQSQIFKPHKNEICLNDTIEMVINYK